MSSEKEMALLYRQTRRLTSKRISEIVRLSSIDHDPCPLCGLRYFPQGEALDSFDICLFCDWEDDKIDYCRPGRIEGANAYMFARFSDAREYARKLIEANRERLHGVPFMAFNDIDALYGCREIDIKSGLSDT